VTPDFKPTLPADLTRSKTLQRWRLIEKLGTILARLQRIAPKLRQMRRCSL
jgi:hypothetical protein